MNPPSATLFGVILVPLTIVAVVAVITPKKLLRHMGGPKSQRVPIKELFLRLAGILILVGALLALHDWWGFR